MTTGDTAVNTGVSLGSGGSETFELTQPGAESVSGYVDRGSGFNLDIVWLDDDGNDGPTESVASGATGVTTFDVPARAAKCRIEVSDSASVSGTFDHALHMR